MRPPVSNANRHYIQYLLNQPALLERIMAFNEDFWDLYERTGHYELEQSELLKTLHIVNPRLAQFKERESLIFDFKNINDRFCLLNEDELEQLVIYLGACIIAPQLKHMVGFEKDSVITNIGEGPYNYAVDHGLYAIRHLQVELEINGIRQDLIYIGVCAAKCILQTLSDKNLIIYFTDRLIRLAKKSGLDPALVKASSHIVTYDQVELVETDEYGNPIELDENAPYNLVPPTPNTTFKKNDSSYELKRKTMPVNSLPTFPFLLPFPIDAKAMKDKEAREKELRENTLRLKQQMHDFVENPEEAFNNSDPFVEEAPGPDINIDDKVVENRPKLNNGVYIPPENFDPEENARMRQEPRPINFNDTDYSRYGYKDMDYGQYASEYPAPHIQEEQIKLRRDQLERSRLTHAQEAESLLVDLNFATDDVMNLSFDILGNAINYQWQELLSK